ncbi:hypothetical protein SFR_1355 [Streptomyces sp. FR-008]|nr:hypothetical protein SFR_1355 [Streptomyces sp. FR-008]
MPTSFTCVVSRISRLVFALLVHPAPQNDNWANRMVPLLGVL